MRPSTAHSKSVLRYAREALDFEAQISEGNETPLQGLCIVEHRNLGTSSQAHSGEMCPATGVISS